MPFLKSSPDSSLFASLGAWTFLVLSTPASLSRSSKLGSFSSLPLPVFLPFFGSGLSAGGVLVSTSVLTVSVALRSGLDLPLVMTCLAGVVDLPTGGVGSATLSPAAAALSLVASACAAGGASSIGWTWISCLGGGAGAAAGAGAGCAAATTVPVSPPLLATLLFA